LLAKLCDIGRGVLQVLLHEGAQFRDERLGCLDELRPGDFSSFVGIPQPEDGADTLTHRHGEDLLGFEGQFLAQGLEITENMCPTELHQATNPALVIFDIS